MILSFPAPVFIFSMTAASGETVIESDAKPDIIVVGLVLEDVIVRFPVRSLASMVSDILFGVLNVIASEPVRTNLFAEVASSASVLCELVEPRKRTSIDGMVRTPPVTLDSVTVAESVVVSSTSKALKINPAPWAPLLLNFNVVPKSRLDTVRVSVDPLL